jgi:hypothetical protein
MFSAASKSGRAGSATPTTDASFAYVPLLLETGSSSSLNTTVTDSSASPNTVTRTGNPSTGWVSPYQTDGYWGNFFPGGASDTLNIATNAIPASGAFTFETFVYPTGTAASQVIAAQYPNGSASGRLMILWNDTANKFTVVLGATTVFVSDATYSANTWLYLVVQRDASNVWSMYVNGTRNTATVTNTTAIDTAVTYIGNRNTGGTPYTGYISNLRVVTSALYSGSTISVPTTPFSVSTTNQVLLTCYSNRFIDANTATTAKVITVTGTPQVTPYFYPSGFTAPAASPGAIYFAANGTYLTAGSAAALALGAGDFTVELWLYATAYNSNTSTVVDWRTNGGVATNIPALFLSTTGVPTFYANISSGALITGSSAVPLNTWTHLAIVRSGTGASNVKMYLNGVSIGSGTNTSTLGIETFSVNNAQGSPQNIYVTYGYIGNLRIVKGTAVYTGTPFTPPSGPLTQTGGTYPSLTNVVTGFSAANTSLLLNLADSNYTSATNGVQNNTFIDESNYAFPITRNGTPTQGSSTPYWPNGQWSNYVNGSSAYLSTASSSAFNVSGDFTLEAWIFPTAAWSAGSFNPIMYVSGTSFYFGKNDAGFGLRQSGVANIISYGTNPTLNVWTHVAIVRNGVGTNNVTMYYNGVSVATATSNVTFSTGTCTIGYDASFGYTGYVSNLRLVKGVAVYTTGFTPSTIPLTATQNANVNGNPSAAITTGQTTFLVCQSNRFIDNSNSALVITPSGTPTVQAFQPFSPTASYTTALYGGSGYFNGSTDYVGAPTGTAFQFGSGDFTIEFWFNQIARRSGGYDGPFILSGNQTAYNADMYLTMGLGSFGYGFVVSNNARNGWAVQITFASALPSLNAWHHMAIVRSGSTFTVYLDGVSIGTATYSGSVNVPQGPFQVGWTGTSDSYFNGYISNFRIVKGTAVYTGAFTPPTLAPLATTGPASAASYSSTTNVNTTFLTPASLLLNMTNAGIYDAAAQNDVTTVGDAQASTTPTPKFGVTTAIKFDPTTGLTTDALSIPSSISFGLGTGDWTIEFWVYLNSTATQTLVSMLTSASSVAPHIYYSNASGIRYFTNSADRITGGALSTGVWNYIAVTKASGVTKMYINGAQTGSNYTDANNYGTANPLAVADYGVPLTGVSTLNGSIQDLRITKGVARTVTTVPTAPFPTR